MDPSLPAPPVCLGLALAIYDAVQANQPQEANALSILTTATVLLILVLVGRMTKVKY